MIMRRAMQMTAELADSFGVDCNASAERRWPFSRRGERRRVLEDV